MRQFTIGVLVGVLLAWVTTLMGILAYRTMPAWRVLKESPNVSNSGRLH